MSTQQMIPSREQVLQMLHTLKVTHHIGGKKAHELEEQQCVLHRCAHGLGQNPTNFHEEHAQALCKVWGDASCGSSPWADMVLPWEVL